MPRNLSEEYGAAVIKLTVSAQTVEHTKLIHGDCFDELQRLDAESVDCVFADPPYFLSNGGFSCSGGEMTSVDKGDWDESRGVDKDYEFTQDWLEEVRRVMKPDATIWISGTHHNIYAVGHALKQLGFDILNEITWFKPNAPPNLSCRYFTHSHETLIWAVKDGDEKHTFNYDEMKQWPADNDKIRNAGKQMRSVWSIPLTPSSEKQHGDHPTQKPRELLRRCILAATNEDDVVLDPFAGSGTTGIPCVRNNRTFIGIERENEYYELMQKRLNSVSKSLKADVYATK